MADASSGPARFVERKPHLVAAATAAVYTALAWYGAHTSDVALLVVLALGQAALILSWVFSLAVPGRWGVVAVSGAAAALADILVMAFPHGQLGALLAPAGLLMIAIFAMQLSRGVVRLRVVESMSDTALLGLAVIALAALLQLRHTLEGGPQASAVVLVTGCAIVVGHLVDAVVALPRYDPAIDRGLLATLAGGVVGAGAAFVQLHSVFGYTQPRSLFLGATLGIVTGLLSVGASFARYRDLAALANGPSAPGAGHTGADHTETDHFGADHTGADHVELDESGADPLLDIVRPSVSLRPLLRPVCTTLWCIAVSVPVGYLLTVALGG